MCDFGLSVSTTNTKFQVVGHDVTGADRGPLLLNGTEIPCVPEFRVLGFVMILDGRSSTDIRQRIASASRAYGVLLKPVFRNKSLSIRTKRHIFTCCVTTVLLYSSEFWTPLQKGSSPFGAFLSSVPCYHNGYLLHYPMVRPD